MADSSSNDPLQLALPNVPTMSGADSEELKTLLPDLYRVAANAFDPTVDTSQMGKIERLLRSGDRAGLQARLGEQQAADVLARYGSAMDKVRQDRSAERSYPRVLSDGAVGIVDSLGSTVLNVASLLAQPTPEWFLPADNPTRIGTRVQQWKGLFDPMYSDELKARRRATAARDAQSELEHQRAAEAAWFAPDVTPSATRDLGIAGVRMGQDEIGRAHV